jgi:hypothetical protein
MNILTDVSRVIDELNGEMCYFNFERQMMKFTTKKSFDMTGIRNQLSQLPDRYVCQLHNQAIIFQSNFRGGSCEPDALMAPVYIAAEETWVMLIIKPHSRG